MENRKHKRHQHQGRIVVGEGSDFLTVDCSDISAGGALVSDRGSFSAGDRVTVIVQLRSFQFHRCSALAVRVQQGGLALKFEKPMTEEQLELSLVA